MRLLLLLRNPLLRHRNMKKSVVIIMFGFLTGAVVMYAYLYNQSNFGEQEHAKSIMLEQANKNDNAFNTAAHLVKNKNKSEGLRVLENRLVEIEEAQKEINNDVLL